MLRRLFCAAVVAVVATLGATQAKAGYTVTLSKEFSDSGAPDYDVAKMQWQNSGGGVLVTLTALFTGGEKLTEFFFNLADTHFIPGPHPNGTVGITQQTGPTATIALQKDHYKADGDGHFDVNLSFPNSGDTFGAGDVATFLISGVTEDDLLNVSKNGGNPNKTGFYAAAHVQSIGAAGNQSGWYASGEPVRDQDPPPAVPAPPTVILAGLGMLGFGGWSRLRRRLAKVA
jgi:hypothetical protein